MRHARATASALRQLRKDTRTRPARGALPGLAPTLRALRLDGNRLSSLAPLAPLTRLETLTVARNALCDLRGLNSHVRLRVLDVAGNALGRLEDVAALVQLPLLGELDLRANPLQLAMGARLHAVHLLPRVGVLDGVPVGAAERVAAGDMHGAHAAALRGVRARWFPQGELDDGGGAIPPAAAGARGHALQLACADIRARLEVCARTVACLSACAWLRRVSDATRQRAFRPRAPALGG